jgi:hypothetical protein
MIGKRLTMYMLLVTLLMIKMCDLHTVLKLNVVKFYKVSRVGF